MAVIVNGIRVSKMHPGDLLGKTSFEENEVRSATLTAISEVGLISLTRVDMLTCLADYMKEEEAANLELLNSIPFFRQFSATKLAVITQSLRQKFLLKNEKCYAPGELAENFYLVKSGKIRRDLYLDMDKTNMWPVGDALWRKKTVTRTLCYSVLLNEKEWFGENELITGERRQERLTAETETLLLFLTKAAFLEIFGENDLKLFANFRKTEVVANRDYLVNEIEKTSEEAKARVIQSLTCSEPL